MSELPPLPKGAVPLPRGATLTPPEKSRDITLRGVGNALKTVGQNLAVETLAGIGGTGQTLLAGPEAGGRYVKNFRDWGSAQLSPEGEAVMTPIGEFIAPVAAPAAEAFEGMGDIMGRGGARLMGALGGGTRMQAGGYALGKAAPEGILAILGAGGAVRQSANAARDAERAARIRMGSTDADLATRRLPPPQRQPGTSLVPTERPNPVQRPGTDMVPTTQELGPGTDLIPSEMPWQPGTGFSRRPDPRQRQQQPPPREQQRLSDGTVKDPLGAEAVKQGFSPGMVQAIKMSPVADKRALREMINIFERTKGNELYGTLNRPADVVGRAIRNRVDLLRDVNRQAGIDLRRASLGLKGQPVNFEGAIDEFTNTLHEMGITATIKKDGSLKINTVGSDIEGLRGIENSVKRLVERMWKTPTPDAYDVHRLKKYIDENVSYGRGTAKGLSGTTEGVFKRLRHNLNQALQVFPEYADANMRYSDTIDVLSNVQKLAGRDTDILGLSGDRAFGRVSRKIFSNYQARDDLISTLGTLDEIAAKYGGRMEDTVVNQALYVQALEKRFGSSASASFQGDIEKAVGRVMNEGIQSGLARSAFDKSGEVFKRRVMGISDEAALKALRALAESRD